MNNLANRKVAGHVSANTESLHFTVDIHSRQHKSLKLTEFVEHFSSASTASFAFYCSNCLLREFCEAQKPAWQYLMQ